MTAPTVEAVDPLASLHAAADSIRWAIDAKLARPDDLGASGRLQAVRDRFAKMLADPANLEPIAFALLELYRLRTRVTVLRGAIGGDPKDVAAGLPDGLTPVGTLDALLRYAIDTKLTIRLIHDAIVAGLIPGITGPIDEDPAAVDDMIDDAANFLEALRGALEVTKDL